MYNCQPRPFCDGNKLHKWLGRGKQIGTYIIFYIIYYTNLNVNCSSNVVHIHFNVIKPKIIKLLFDFGIRNI